MLLKLSLRICQEIILKKQWVIAIDGPSGSGKSTCAKILAKKLGLLYIDTGAMYRGLALWAYTKSIAFEEGPELEEFLKNIKFEYGVSEEVIVQVDGVDLSQKIREHEVSRLASMISQLSTVREYLVAFQRTLPQTKVCVMEGRDIGSVVFPNAFCKFFISTKPAIRGKRRLNELKEKGETNLTLEQVIKDIEERDRFDQSRAHSPLVQTEDAEYVENGEELDETIEKLIKAAKAKASSYEVPL